MGQKDSLEKAVATHFNILAWRIPWTVHGVAKGWTQLSNFHSFIHSQVVQVVKNQPANAEDIRNAALIPRSGRSLGEGNGKPLQYSCLENPIDRGSWWAIVHGVTRSQTWLNTHYYNIIDQSDPASFQILNVLTMWHTLGSLPLSFCSKGRL